jgi:hypothetical protein
MSVLALTIGKALIPGLIDKLVKGKGKVAEEVAKIALEATGLTSDSSPDTVIDVLNRDPIAFARVKEAAAAVAIAEIEAEIDAERVAMQDRVSARDLKAKSNDKTANTLSLIAALFALASLLVVSVVALSGYVVDPVYLTLLGTATGYGFAYFQQVMNFYFGSSAGSKKKTDLIGG